jgi:membrane protease subunit HflK
MDFRPEDIVRGAGGQMFRQFPVLVPLALLALLGTWLVMGFYVVGPGEVGVVRRFGKEIRRTDPGLRYRVPWPVERIDVVNLEQIRRAEIGFRTVARQAGAGHHRIAEEGLMLTGDENIVEAQLIVQYQISDPSKYLFQVQDPDGMLHSSTEVALRSMVGNTMIDEILTVGREKVQTDTRDFLQRLLDAYGTGLRVTEVRLQVVDPPDQVKDAFHEVVRAREDRERLINQAQGYSEDIIPKARGLSEQMVREAEAYQQERMLRAQGDASRFLAVLEDYTQAKDVTRTRLHLETMERTLRSVRMVVVDPKVGGVQPLLPLTEFRLRETPQP